jgi:hypothetical protein
MESHQPLQVRCAPAVLGAGLLFLPGLATADDWSSVGYAVVTAYLLAGIFLAQQLVCIVLAVLRARARGLKSALRFWVGSIFIVPAAVGTLAMLSRPLDALTSPTASPWIFVTVFAATAVVFCLLHLAWVRSHDRRPENLVWRTTR